MAAARVVSPRRSLPRRLAALASLAALAACGGGAAAPAPSAGAAPSPAAPPSAAAPREPAQAPQAPREPFAALRDRILREWAADEPAFARSRGLHEHDGEVGDYSAAAIERRLARLER